LRTVPALKNVCAYVEDEIPFRFLPLVVAVANTQIR
jgi:hypothetical protein